MDDQSDFDKWFGDSKIVDENGNPRVVYHATSGSAFEQFDKTKQGRGANAYGLGFYFSGDKESIDIFRGPASSWKAELTVDEATAMQKIIVAINQVTELDDKEKSRAIADLHKRGPASFAEMFNLADYPELQELFVQKNKRSGHVFEAHLSIQKPFNAETDTLEGMTYDQLTRKYGDKQVNSVIAESGYDGIISDTGDDPEFVAFEPNQIKLASNKNPTSDPRMHMEEGGIVPNDPTKHSKPGKKDKVPALLEEGEAVGTRQDVAAMQSLLTTGGAKGMGIGGIAKGPGGSGIGLAGALGQMPLQMADGGVVGNDSNAKTEIGMPGIYTSPQQMAAEVAIQRSQQTLAHAPGRPLATALRDVGSPTGQAATQTTAAFSTSVKETQLETLQNQTGQTGVGPLAKPPTAGLLPGDIGAGNQPVTGSGPDDWSLPSSTVDKPTVPGSPGGQGSADAPWATPAPKEGRRGRLAKPPSMDKFWGGLGSAAIDTMVSKAPGPFQGIFAGTLKDSLGMASRGIGSGHGSGGGMGSMLTGLLGGSGGMGELLGGGGKGGSSGDNQALMDAIKALTDAVEALTEMIQSQGKDAQPGIKPDGSFVPSLGKSAATMLAGAPSQGTTQKGDASADMQKTITDTLLRAAMQAAMAAI